MSILYCTGGELEGSAFPIKNDLKIGRVPSNDIVIKDSFVSKEHAFLYDHSGDIYLIDNDSHNGLYINNIKFKLKRLNQGDRIKIGKNFFIYYEGSDDLFQREYEIVSHDNKDAIKDSLLKEAEFHENYLQIFYKIISPYLQTADRVKFWADLKNVIYRFNIENFLLLKIDRDNSIKKLEVLTSYYDKIPQIDENMITLMKTDNIITMKRSVESIQLKEYLVMYPFKRAEDHYIWCLGRFAQGELNKDELNQLYFTGLILSFLK